MGMRFKDRVKISMEYAEWLKAENKKNDFNMPFNPETFLAYLETRKQEKEELYTLYKGMSESMQKAVKDIMLVANGKEIEE